MELDPNHKWYKVAETGVPNEGGRIHVKVNDRFVTVFRNRGKLTSLDSVCYHASGPMTQGPVSDIEELGVTVVSCPWHKFMVTLDGGLRAYQAVEFVGGKPVNAGWTLGKQMHRSHLVHERPDGVFVVRTTIHLFNWIDLFVHRRCSWMVVPAPAIRTHVAHFVLDSLSSTLLPNLQ